MELLQYWHIVRKRIWLIILLMCLALLGAGYYVLQQAPLYRTSTTLMVRPATLDSTISYTLSDGMLPLANTYSEFMKSRSFAQALATKLENQGVEARPSEGEILNAINAYYIDGTQLFRITATHSDPQIAKALADTTAQMLVDANAERIRAQQAALEAAQANSRRVQEIDRLAEMISLIDDELDYYEERIQALERNLEILQSGPQSSETDAAILDARSELLNARGARVELLANLSRAQQALLAETEKANDNLDTVVIVEEALLPTEPLPRDLLQPLLAAVAVALGLGVALAVGLEYLDSSVKGPEELDLAYGMPTLAAIGIVEQFDPALGHSGSLMMLHTPRTPVSETIRLVRTAIRMASIGRPLRSLLVTSAQVGEGKTFVAANLAISFAQAGKRVVLVDTDLRRPEIHKLFGLRHEPGFTNLLVEELSIGQVLRPTRVPNLQILPCGTFAPNPAELLSSEQASALLGRLANEADLVIYDSSPATTVSDALMIASQVDGVVQVVSARGTHIKIVQRCKELLERSGASVVGAVLNRVEASNLGYYRNYYSEGGYFPMELSQPAAGWRWPWQGSVNGKPQRSPSGAGTTERTSELDAVNGHGNGHKPELRSSGRPANDNPITRARGRR